KRQSAAARGAPGVCPLWRTVPRGAPGRASPDAPWLALLLCQRGEPFACGLRPGMQLAFGEGFTATVMDRDTTTPRLWQLRFSAAGPALIGLVYRLGGPVRYA